MTNGHLTAGERLPSTRALAATLGVSRTVVTGAYAQLFAEGWIEGRHGSGTYVADGASASDGTGVSGGAGASVGASRAGADAGEETDGRAAGVPAGHGRRSRAVRCGPEQIMVTRGVAGSLGLIAAGLLRPGDRVGVEEPGYPTARAVFAAHGARLVPCPVDADGLVVDALPAGLRLV